MRQLFIVASILGFLNLGESIPNDYDTQSAMQNNVQPPNGMGIIKGETTPRTNIEYQSASGGGYQGGQIGSGYPGYPGYAQGGGYPQQGGGYPQQAGGYPQQGGYPQGYPQGGYQGYPQGGNYQRGYYPGEYNQGGYQQYPYGYYPYQQQYPEDHSLIIKDHLKNIGSNVLKDVAKALANKGRK